MNPVPIPPVESATEPIDCTGDLQQRWRALMQELGFGERLLRFTFIGPDRRFVKILTELEIGVHPHPSGLDNLMHALGRLLRDMGAGHTVAFLLTRPGRGGVSDDDRRWCAAVVEAAERHGIPTEPMFRANDEALVPLTADAADVQRRRPGPTAVRELC